MNRIAIGLIAGLAGTGAEVMASGLWDRRRGAPAVFAPERMATRLAARRGITLSPPAARWAGIAMRSAYGPAWALVLQLLFARRRVPAPVAAPGLALSILGFELIALPLAGATPALRRWTPGELFQDGVNATAYATVAVALLAWLDRGVRP